MPTSNPVPSQDPSDLLFNAGKLDEAVNSSASTFTDRKGVTRMTVAGAVAAMASDVSSVESAKISGLADIAADVATVDSTKNTAINTTIPGYVAAVEARKNTAINSEIPAAVALVDTEVAETAAGAASAAKVAAEAARDAAQLAAGVYATTAAGLAATTNGQYFNVPASSANDSLILYQNSSGTAVEVKRYPSAEKVSQLLSSAPKGYAWALVDASGMAAFGVETDGSVKVASLNGTEITANTFSQGGNVQKPIAPSGKVWALADAAGRAAVCLASDGTLEVASISALFINGGSPQTKEDLYDKQQGNVFSYEITHVISYGQSLSQGGTSGALVTTLQRFDNLMFAGGINDWVSGDPATNHASLVPLISSGATESPITGMTDGIKELISSENGINYTSQTYQLLGSGTGQGATAIDGLSKGQLAYANVPAYANTISDVNYGISRAAALNKTYGVGAITWMQGEADYQAATDPGMYYSKFRALIKDFNNDILPITGQAEKIQLISYQISSHRKYPAFVGNPTIALAQLRAAVDDENIHLSTPMYFFPYASDEIHLTNAGSKWCGAYHGKVYKRVVIDKKVWRPLMPRSTFRQGALLMVRFHVPVMPLVFDTTLFTEQTNKGFTLVDSAGAAITINSVSIVGPDTVKIVAATTIPAGAKVRYGFANGGNLRDSDQQIFDATGINKPMYNWCVIFEETIN